MLDPEWIEHRRGRDGEGIGWIAPAGDDFIAVDLLGRHLTEPVDWLTAEQTLDSLGIGYLADRYDLRMEDGSWLRVRITEVSSGAITVSEDHGGAIDAPQVDFPLPFPITTELRLRDRSL